MGCRILPPLVFGVAVFGFIVLFIIVEYMKGMDPLVTMHEIGTGFREVRAEWRYGTSFPPRQPRLNTDG